jgi:hypothetical protein
VPLHSINSLQGNKKKATMISYKFCILVMASALLSDVACGFAPSLAGQQRSPGTASMATSTTSLSMANDDDLLRWARSSRSAGADDNVVELMRPIGVVLAEDDNGNVFVETVAPNGNAARSGKVRYTKLARIEIYKNRMENATNHI